jgi:hypothetical protein
METKMEDEQEDNGSEMLDIVDPEHGVEQDDYEEEEEEEEEEEGVEDEEFEEGEGFYNLVS